MNDHETERIAKAVNVLRPDWPVNSLITLMGREQLRHRPRRDVLVAFAWVAAETNTSNPGRVLEAGPWWKAVAVNGSTGGHPHPLRVNDPDECRIHAGQHRDHCSGCQADSLVGDSTPTPQRQRTGPTEAWKVARQELDLKHALEPKTETKEEAS